MKIDNTNCKEKRIKKHYYRRFKSQTKIEEERAKESQKLQEII